jgi:putative ABC transport system permease protein
MRPPLRDDTGQDAPRNQPRAASVRRHVLTNSFLVSFSTLRANPLRTFLSTLGIVIGVASLVAGVSLGDGMERYFRTQIGQTTDLQAIGLTPRQTREVDGVNIPLDSPVVFTMADAAALEAAVRPIAVAGATAPGVAIARVDGAQRAVRLVATMAPLLQTQGITVAAGRLFTHAEDSASVVLLSSLAARELAGRGRPPLAPGDSMTLGNTRLAVIGILTSTGGGDEKLTAIVPTGTAPRVIASAASWSPFIVVLANRVEDVTPARVVAEKWLATRFGPDWPKRVTVANRAERVAQAQQAMLIFKLFMGAITGISLLVGGIGVMNVLLAAVAERTREIGIRRAVGAARRHILAQFLAESVTISGVGSLAGIVIGVAGAYGITAIIRANSKAEMYAGLSVSTVLVAVLATVTVGLAFGLYPALLASKLSPIDAIRHE